MQSIALTSLLGFAFLTAAAPGPAAGDWMQAVPVGAAAKAPRILLIHDMEGLSGQDDPYSFLFGHPAYPQMRKLLTADVNAVIDGLFAGGASSVEVADGHGSGNPDADMLIDQLDRRARMVTRAESFDTYSDLPEKGKYDAVVVVGMHAKSGSGGFASHTYSLGSQISVNGHAITETELVGLLHGPMGVPVIFASGDDHLAKDLATMPWIQYVITKKAVDAGSVELLPVSEVHAAMRKKAALAVRQLGSAKVMTLRAPVRMQVHAIPPASLEWLKDFPGVEYRDQTVSYTAPDMAAAYRSMRPIVWAMGSSYDDAERTVIDRHPDGARLHYDGEIELFRRWIASESGKPEPAKPAQKGAPREHHGFS